MADSNERTQSRHSGTGDPRQQNPASIGRGQGSSMSPKGSAAHASGSAGRSSEESDARPYEPRPDTVGKPLTMGSNGGGADSDIEGDGLEQSINAGRSKDRKAS
jgi:hypothetical protein